MSHVDTREPGMTGRVRGGMWSVAAAALAAGCVLGTTVALVFLRVPGTARPSSQPPVLFSVDTSQKIVALTFDDGPDPAYDYEILAILRRYRVHATFFLEGRNAVRHPEVVRAELAAGHEVANHTMNHRDMEFVSDDVMRAEIEGAGRVIERAGGVRPIYFRPPRGHLNLEAIGLANRLGYRVVLWSMGLERVKGYTLAQDADVVARNLRPGLVILAHDASRTRWWVPRVLPRMIKGIQARGYRIVSLGELLRAEGT